MKVGIITQPLSSNYGGILQNFALQQVLKRMGHTPITLDLMPSLSFCRYLLYAGKGVLCAFSPRLRHPIKPYSHYLKRRPEIDAFVQENISLSRTVSHYSKTLLKKYGIEAILVGSDQVWRYLYNSLYIEDMYLAFARDYPCLKITYGASFGIDEWDYPEKMTSEAKALIRQFTAVSVREDAATRLCKDYLEVDAAVVLDPTLLLSASDYKTFCQAPDPESRPYLAAYILDINEEKKAYIKAVANRRGLEIRDMTVSHNGVSIEEWLSTIHHAEYVITDSYHGSLFSIIFQKPFRTIINKERGAVRFQTLFVKLGLTDCLLDSIPAEPACNDLIDYTPVYSALQRLQEESITFLQKSLN